jgi:hypothetical protein
MCYYEAGEMKHRLWDTDYTKFGNNYELLMKAIEKQWKFKYISYVISRSKITWQNIKRNLWEVRIIRSKELSMKFEMIYKQDGRY